MLQKILIANRGEIAIRVIRTAKAMGIKTVAIYSDADIHALHRYAADESYRIGPAPSAESYLAQDRILEIAQKQLCDGIHPGYGFLSENADFALLVEEAGIKFIGPSAHSIRLMGDKLAAKRLAREHGIPLLPGTDEPVSGLEAVKVIAGQIGYPILLKAAGGGGGKGMRIVDQEKDLESLFALATSEARQSFGDPRVFMEKYLDSPKHIEIQIMADQYGEVVHVFERECSIQRRHQKIIEEAPAPRMTPELREQMTRAAITIARACRYEGAGTVEFLVDRDQQFYFLEMNTRLQVEHPVTESISGLDLVRWQIDIANGKKLPLRQDQITCRGHSIELRVYAEDMLNDFAPSLGRIFHYEEPEGDGIRIDGAAGPNFEVPIYYDPLLAKLIVWGSSRSETLSLLKKAISRYQILGIQTTLPLGLFIADHPEFVSGDYDTHFVRNHFSASRWLESNTGKARIAGLVAALCREHQIRVPQENKSSSTWRLRRQR
jgi:pyruvate carboxylase subunit A